ncbi:MAG: fimbrillin family protein [Paludibacteraceae bacterium]|nr:fimbrillin family protein [Paludibacteraceae bacterium]
MKKLFIFALAGLGFASCSDDENVVSEKKQEAGKQALSFSTYTAGGTRATDVTSAEVETSGFQVAAWYDGSLYFNAGESATVNTADNIYDTDGDTYYWPSFSAGKIGFKAFNKGVGAAWTAAKEYESIDFTVAATAADQKDLVIAYAEAASKPTNGVQPLNFTHALSKVNFSFVGKNAANKYTINKVEVIAAGGAATMAFAETTELAAGGVDTNQPGSNEQNDKVSWTYTAIDSDNALVNSTGAAQGVLYTYKTGDVVVNGTTAEKLDENFMLLPQSGKIAVRVYYKVETLKKGSTTEYNLIGNCGYEATDKKGHHASQAGYDADNGAILGCKTVVIDLDGTMAPAWEAGKAYRFTLTLPDDNFIGDISGDGVADGLDDKGDADASNDVDLDGDNDKDPSEFDILTPIRFSVTVSAWVDATPANSNITIK